MTEPDEVPVDPLGKVTLDQLAELLASGALPEDLAKDTRLARRLRDGLAEANKVDPQFREGLRALLEVAAERQGRKKPPGEPTEEVEPEGNTL
jgi:hypothetical protein